MRISYWLLSFILLSTTSSFSQKERVKNQPYVDLKRFHLGFHVGIHTQDLILTNSGIPTATGETLFAEIPSYSPGFSVGIIGNLYLSQFMNLRMTPTINFGDKKIRYKAAGVDEFYETSLRSNYLSLPLSLKVTSLRLNNVRPYILGGIYGAADLGRKKGNAVLLNSFDCGVEVGFGCDIYLPYFKLCPELKFSFGLIDLLKKDRSDLTDESLIVYTNALSKAKSRMISLVFNFE